MDLFQADFGVRGIRRWRRRQQISTCLSQTGLRGQRCLKRITGCLPSLMKSCGGQKSSLVPDLSFFELKARLASNCPAGYLRSSNRNLQPFCLNMIFSISKTGTKLQAAACDLPGGRCTLPTVHLPTHLSFRRRSLPSRRYICAARSEAIDLSQPVHAETQGAEPLVYEGVIFDMVSAQTPNSSLKFHFTITEYYFTVI